MPLALFGIDDGGLNLAVNLLVLFLIVIWVALIAWTYLDARRRIEDRFLVMCATVASVFPFVGTIVYTILRPPEFLEDARERELEIRSTELRVRQLTEASCPNCEHPIEKSYLRCPGCRARLKDPCPSCSKPLDPRWSVCPYCELPIQRRRRPAEKRRSREEGRPRSEASRQERAAGAEASKRRAVARPKRAPAPPPEPAESSRPRLGRRSKDRKPEDGGKPAESAAPTAEEPARPSERPAPTS
jgi:hypothetical protein